MWNVKSLCSLAPVACGDGEYSLIEAKACTVCPAGYECPNKDQYPTPCPSGTYSVGSAISCDTCGAGVACPSVAAADTVACDPGE